jgi:hypothetical protein
MASGPSFQRIIPAYKIIEVERSLVRQKIPEALGAICPILAKRWLIDEPGLIIFQLSRIPLRQKILLIADLIDYSFTLNRTAASRIAQTGPPPPPPNLSAK